MVSQPSSPKGVRSTTQLAGDAANAGAAQLRGQSPQRGFVQRGIAAAAQHQVAR